MVVCELFVGINKKIWQQLFGFIKLHYESLFKKEKEALTIMRGLCFIVFFVLAGGGGRGGGLEIYCRC